MRQGQAGSYAAAALAFSVAKTLQATADDLAGETSSLVDGESLLWEIRTALDTLQDTIAGYQAEAQDLI